SINYLAKLTRAMDSASYEEIFDIINTLLATIPYDIHLPYEKYWQTAFYLIFTVLGFRTTAELRTSLGRIDAVITSSKHIYLFEFKLLKKGTTTRRLLKEAARQINETEYAKRFACDSRQLHKLTAVFDEKDRKSIIKWKIVV
ncbi:MAG: PD-(D/E)XK nuclease domain-containing protein, partial [Spirochaetales bacterium]|nr:PD-(D/E)XK nuclease domain-containing protein [Spirochaetales bacterium]